MYEPNLSTLPTKPTLKCGHTPKGISHKWLKCFRIEKTRWHQNKEKSNIQKETCLSKVKDNDCFDGVFVLFVFVRFPCIPDYSELSRCPDLQVPTHLPPPPAGIQCKDQHTQTQLCALLNDSTLA